MARSADPLRFGLVSPISLDMPINLWRNRIAKDEVNQRTLPVLTINLTDRQRQCLQGVLHLKSAKEIARDLGISAHAVEKHLRASRDKLGAQTSAEAARLFAADRRLRGENPHYGFTELPSSLALGHEQRAQAKLNSVEVGGTGVIERDDDQLQPFSPGKTLAVIAIVAFGSVASLLMLIACAQALNALF